MDAWLNGGMLQSLAVRQQMACDTSARIATLLDEHPAVSEVHYPGLPGFPQAAVAKKQMRNGGAVIAFELSGGYKAGENLMNHFTQKDIPVELAVSLGSAISLIEHPASMTHAGVPESDRLDRGITEGLVRLSVGLEGYDQLAQGLLSGLK